MTIEHCWMILPGHKVGYGDIVVEGDEIAEINFVENGMSSEQRTNRPADHQKLVMPGLINCHGHTAMTLVRGLGSGLPLQRWLEEAIFPVEAKMKSEDVSAGNIWGIREMLAGGTTCVADMYDFPEEMAKALRETGMKGRICRVGLNFIPGRLEECVEFTRGWNGQQAHDNKKAVADICIHSEYLTDETFCRELAAANRELKRPLHVHVSETEKEHNECIARHGKTPIAYLAETGILDHGGYAAHCVWCTDDDFRIMAEKGVALIHNPSSNMKLGSGFARVPAAIAAGVNVALGTDGCASNDNLDLFEEMHLASLIHKGLARDPTTLPTWEVIEMATKNGAKALGLADTGELKAGFAADLCVVDLKKPHLTPALDLPNLVVHSMHASDVEMTVVDGEVLYERGQWLTLNQDRAEYDFRSAVRRLGL